MFITFEANEGAGKTTQVKLLVKALLESGYDVVQTREPGGSTGAEEIRNLVLQGATDRWSAMTELLLFTAARRDHLERTVRPALEAGKVVVCDRYVGSTLALQVAGGADRKKVLDLHQIACDGQMPDLTIFLDMESEAALARSNARNAADASPESRMEEKGSTFHSAVSLEFKRQAEEFNWARINADQPIEAVHIDIMNTVSAALHQRALKKAG